MISGIHHAAVIVTELNAATAFYRDVLGLPINPHRPDLGYEGVWFDVGPQQLHLMVLPNPEAAIQRPQHAGRDRHLALSVSALEDIRIRLENENIPFTLSRSGRKALFCRDPDGNGIELVENV